jgi:uncharacterized membrane protein YbaN (DUF454 family)
MERERAETTRRTRHAPRSLARRILGWLVLSLGLLGLALPVLPGLLLLGLGIVILGPRDPSLRRLAIRIRLLLRRWSKARHPHLRRLGCYVRSRYRASRLALRTYLHDYAHGRYSWTSHLLMLTFSLIGVAVTATTMYVIWRAFP